MNRIIVVGYIKIFTKLAIIMNTLLQSQSHPNLREQRFKPAQVTNAKRTEETIRKYKTGELQYHKTVSQAFGITHVIPRPVCKINGWKTYTRFAYTADPEKRQLILEPCYDVRNNALALCSGGTIKICYNICALAGWEAGDTISVVLRGEKTIMERVKTTENVQAEPKEELEKINHVSLLGDFQFLPDYLISKKNDWTVGTRFSCSVEDAKIVLEESETGERQISGCDGNIGRINISKSICLLAKLHKHDPVKVDYEDKKIIIRRA